MLEALVEIAETQDAARTILSVTGLSCPGGALFRDVSPRVALLFRAFGLLPLP